MQNNEPLIEEIKTKIPQEILDKHSMTPEQVIEKLIDVQGTFELNDLTLSELLDQELPYLTKHGETSYICGYLRKE